MQTHFSTSDQQEQVSIDGVSTQAVGNQSIREQPADDSLIQPSTYLTSDKVQDLLKVEQLVIKLLLSGQTDNAPRDNGAPVNIMEREPGQQIIKLGDLVSKFNEHLPQQEAEEFVESCKQVSFLLSHLPFVNVTGSDIDSEVSLINPSSIAKSVATGGAA